MACVQVGYEYAANYVAAAGALLGYCAVVPRLWCTYAPAWLASFQAPSLAAPPSSPSFHLERVSAPTPQDDAVCSQALAVLQPKARDMQSTMVGGTRYTVTHAARFTHVGRSDAASGHQRRSRLFRVSTLLFKFDMGPLVCRLLQPALACFHLSPQRSSPAGRGLSAGVRSALMELLAELLLRGDAAAAAAAAGASAGAAGAGEAGEAGAEAAGAGAQSPGPAGPGPGGGGGVEGGGGAGDAGAGQGAGGGGGLSAGWLVEEAVKVLE